MKFHTTEKLGPKQSLTPEGFLLCLDVPLARTGMMIYGPDETPIKASADGLVRIFREESEVFNDITLASANGKPVVNEHPDSDVLPENWLQLAKGVCLNPRRGLGAMDDLMVGDLLITVPEEIEAVQAGKREISLGYDADYEQTAEGAGKQTNIIINHIALVESGRCGPRCAIGDHNHEVQLLLKKEPEMAKGNKFKDMLMKAFKAKDAEEVEKMAEGMNDEDMGGAEGETHIHIHNNADPIPSDLTADEDEPDEMKKTADAEMAAWRTSTDERLEALEKGMTGTGDADDPETMDAMEGEMPEGVTKDQARKAKDSAYLTDSFQETVSLAEIIAPGIRIPTFDRAARPASSLKSICALRSQALDLAYAQPQTRGLIDELLAGKTLDTKKMTCDATRSLFRSVAALKKTENKKATFSVSDNEKNQTRGVKTIADLNKLNAEYYNKK